MIIFIFKDIEELTDNFHSGGGLVVIASDRKRAEELIEAKEDLTVSAEEWEEVLAYPTTEQAEEELFLFPDAGCC